MLRSVCLVPAQYRPVGMDSCISQFINNGARGPFDQTHLTRFSGRDAQACAAITLDFLADADAVGLTKSSDFSTASPIQSILPGATPAIGARMAGTTAVC